MASVGQGGYLSPMAAFAAAQMQHMATINGLPGAPLTPTSGEERRRMTRRVWWFQERRRRVRNVVKGPEWRLG